MTSQEAKETLLLYRPGVADADDPDFTEALELTRQDPELARWFQEHCKLQEALRVKFNQIAVPEGLKEQILSERTVHLPPARPRKQLLFAVTAAFVVLFLGLVSVLFWPQREDNRFANFRNRMASTVLRQYPRMDLETNNLASIHQFLAQRGHGDYVLPAGLTKAAATGCATLSWHEKELSMVCFNSGSNGKPGEPDLFLFIIDRSAVRQSPSEEPEFFRLSRRFMTVSWVNGDKAYLLGARGDEEMLRKYL